MGKNPSRAAKHGAGEATFSSGSPWAAGCWESRATKWSLCIFQNPLFFPKPSICYVVVPLSLEMGSQARWSFGLTHYGHFRFSLQQLTLLAYCLSFAIQVGRAVPPKHPPHTLAPVNAFRRGLPLEQTCGQHLVPFALWRKPLGSACNYPGQKEEMDMWREEAAHSPSSGGASTRSTAQMSSYCSPTMINSILNTTSQTSYPQLRRGLPGAGHPPGLSAQEVNSHLL